MIKLAAEEWFQKIKDEGVEFGDVKFVCPSCGTEQSMNDLIEAGVDPDKATNYVAFSCIGRFDESKGCNWTLGGLFQIHEVEVETPDGVIVPQFRLASMPKEEEAA